MATLYILGYMLTRIWQESKYYTGDQQEQPNNIRLLRVCPGLRSDPLQVSVVVTSIEKFEPYYVILHPVSCVLRETLIWIDGTALEVTESSESVLRELRRTDVPILLWDETISIDQHTIQEYPIQRSLTAKIFASAKEATVWLGPSNTDIEIGLLLLKYFAQGGRKTQDELPLWIKLPPDMVRGGLSSVFDHSWVRSRRVAQAAPVAPTMTVRCGNLCESWSNDLDHILLFSRALKFAVVHPRWRDLGFNGVDMDHMVRLLQRQIDFGPHWEIYNQSRRPIDELLDLMYKLRNNNATDPRDKVYAILGLVDLGSPSPITPDYTQSLTTLYDRLEDLIFTEDG